MEMVLTVFYDGLCIVCSREVDHYRKHRNAGRIRWVDITDPSFDARAENLDPDAVNAKLHVRRHDGQVVTGVDSFLEIWRALEGYGLLRAVVGFKPTRPLMDFGYEAFARIRPYLPKRKKEACDTGVCDPGARPRKSADAS